MNKSEEEVLKLQILDLRFIYSQFTHTDDVRRLKAAADTIESLISCNHVLQLQVSFMDKK